MLIHDSPKCNSLGWHSDSLFLLILARIFRLIKEFYWKLKYIVKEYSSFDGGSRRLDSNWSSNGEMKLLSYH